MPKYTPFRITESWLHSPQAAIDPTRPELSAKGKIVVVAGGGGLIGRSIATAFVEAQADAVVILGRTEKTLVDAVTSIKGTAGGSGGGTDLFYVVADVTDRTSVDRAMEAVVKKYGKEPSVLVSNAGYCPKPAPAATADAEDWWRSFEVNVRGGFNVVQSFLALSKNVGGPEEREGPIVINVSASLAHTPAAWPVSGYSCAKLATAKFFEYVQAENPALRVVNVHPGVIEGEMTDIVGAPKEIMDDWRLPGQFIVWVCSPEAKFLHNGKFASANWDIDDLKAHAKEIEETRLLQMGLEGYAM